MWLEISQLENSKNLSSVYTNSYDVTFFSQMSLFWGDLNAVYVNVTWYKSLTNLSINNNILETWT